MEQIVFKRTENSVSFYVDKDLPAPKQKFKSSKGTKIAKNLLSKLTNGYYKNSFIKTSFEHDTFCYWGTSALFHTFVFSYADHRPLILSPDDIWLAILQGFSHYVNLNAKELRNLFVSHKDKKSLYVESSSDLLSEDVKWEDIFDLLCEQIKENTIDDSITNLQLTFSTTTSTEKIVSQITLMDLLKPYFNYVVFCCICGIPYITLKGTPKDWQSILDKIPTLDKFGLSWWTQRLKPIIKEFVDASNGNPRLSFWQDIVCRKTPNRLRGRGCVPDNNTTLLDGWFLSFFPFDKKGRTPDKVEYMSDNLLPEIVKVDFKYIRIDSKQSTSFPMELYAGFVGLNVNGHSKALSPKIGWLVRKADEVETIKERYNYKDLIYLECSEVPEELMCYNSIKHLRLVFTNEIELPSWLKKIQIETLSVSGKISAERKNKYIKEYPNIQFERN